MSVIYFLIIVFLTLIFYTLISSTIKISLFLTTGKRYEDSRLILPTFTTLLTWVLIFFIWNAFLNRYLNLKVYDLVSSVFYKDNIIAVNFKPLLTITIISFVICIVIQALSYFLANVDIKKIIGNFRFGIKKAIYKAFNKNDDEILVAGNTDDSYSNTYSDEEIKNFRIGAKISNNTTTLKIAKESEELNFFNALVASLFSTSVVIFFTTVLFIYGFNFANKIIG